MANLVTKSRLDPFEYSKYLMRTDNFLRPSCVVKLPQIVDIDTEHNSDDSVEIVELAQRLILKVTNEAVALLGRVPFGSNNHGFSFQVRK